MQSHRKSEADLGQAGSLPGARRAPAGRTQEEGKRRAGSAGV
jgi:hypothetical protein